MKTYLFRGKRIDYEKYPKEQWWVEGEVSHHKTGKVFIKEKNGSALSSIEIQAETLSQYIGKDIKGNSIYEYSYVKEEFSDGSSIICPVIYLEKYAGFMVQDGPNLYHINFEIDKFEVVGNIFDDPDLLSKYDKYQEETERE